MEDVYYKNIEPRIGFAWSPSALGHKSVFPGTYNILNAPILEWQQIYAGIPNGYSLTGQVNNVANPFASAELLDPSSTNNPINVNPGA